MNAMITGVIETIMNQLARLSTGDPNDLHRLRGKIVKLTIKEWQEPLYFIFSQQHIDVLAVYDGASDCELGFSLQILPKLQDQANITTLIKSDQLTLEGDLSVAQQFSKAMLALKPDIEECLSLYTGDVVAHGMVRTAKVTQEWLQYRLLRHNQVFAQAITEEWRLAPQGLEIAHFADQVDDIHSDVERLSVRIEQLLGR